MIEKFIEISVKQRGLALLIFASLALLSLWGIKKTPLDALPDLTPPQVILQIKWQGQSPKVIDDQITYPLTSALLRISNIETVRGFSSYETGLVYIIFKEGTDLYAARSRVLEELASISLPKGASVTLGPDASGVGWVYEYALVSKNKDLAQLRTYQDYTLKYALLDIEGVSEVASVGGFIPQFEVLVSNDALIKYNLSIKDIVDTLRKNNNDVGGGISIHNGYEWIVQARGYTRSLEEIGNLTIKTIDKIPLRIKDVASVHLSSVPRRGMADLDGKGEVVGGIVIAKYGADVYSVIQKVKKRLHALERPDIKIVPVYDRSDLIKRSIENLKHTLIEESLIVIAVIALFLFHFRSSLIMIVVLPLTIGVTFLLMYLFHIGSNIMSLGGIAIAIGAMVDASIVMIENVHKKLERKRLSQKDRIVAIIESSKMVGKPIFFALALVVVSFLPIFLLQGQEGRLFAPLAYTKTFAMSVGALLAITLVPALMSFLIHRVPKESSNPLNKLLIWLYRPIFLLSMKLRYILFILLVAVVAYLIPVAQKLKWEFMPPLDEGTLMYMPVTAPGIGIDLAKEITQKTDAILKKFDAVERVFGKAGRADTATDPAPLSMIETIVTLKPKSQWRDSNLTTTELMQQMDEALQIPGLVNSWTYPIRGRIDMLLSGIRTPLGLKLYGDDLSTLQNLAKEIEQKLGALAQSESVFADKSDTGYFYDIDLNVSKLAQYGLSKSAVLDLVGYALAGKKVTTLYKGIERYPIAVRFDESDRIDLEAIKKIRVATPYGYIRLEDLASIKRTIAPSVLKRENAKPVTYIYITPKGSSQTFVKEAKKVLQTIDFPPGYYYEWAGESRYLQHAMEQLYWIVPLVVVLIVLLIYFALGNWVETIIVFSMLPFALLGGLYLVELLDYNLSIAVIVGFLALLGIAAETAIVMIVYLKESVQAHTITSKKELFHAIYEGAVQRVRPKIMTVSAILAGLIPILYSHASGSEIMQRIAAPMIGGVGSSALVSLLIIPILYYEYQKFIKKLKD